MDFFIIPLVHYPYILILLYLFHFQEENLPAKKLRLLQRSSAPSISLNLKNNTNSQDVLFILLKVSNNIPSDKEGADSIYAELSEHLAIETDPIVRCKIISIYGRLALVPGFCAQNLGDDILLRITTESKYFYFRELSILD